MQLGRLALAAALCAAVAAADPQLVAKKRIEPRALDSNNLRHQIDMPDYQHVDPCNPNLDLDAHSIGHGGSGLAEEDTWSRPPPSFRCPPPSPPSAPAPPSVRVQSASADDDDETGDLPACELPAALEAYQRDDKWDASSTRSLCLLSQESVTKGITCRNPRTPGRCVSPPIVPSGYEFISNGTGAGRFTISAGVKASCVHNSRALHCWGSNEGDKLSLHKGIRSASGGYAPTEQAGWTRIVETRNDSVSEIHVGAVFSCALRSSGQVTCFGGDVASNGDFVWHRARTTRYGARRKIEHLRTHVNFAMEGQRVTQFDLQEVHTCFVGSKGGLACIGENIDGQLGDGSTWAQWGNLLPVRELQPLVANAGVLQVATGHRHTCALTNERTVVCWGHNAEGQLGLGHRQPMHDVDYMRALRPLALGGAVRSIAAGDEFNCAIVEPVGATDGKTEVRCWGRNNFGQLGLGDTRARGVLPGEMGSDNLPPTPFDNVYGKNLAAARSIELGRFHACVLTIANELKCWGNNEYGQLGLGDRVNRGDNPNELFRSKETYVGRFDRPHAVSAGERHTCVLSYEGESPDPQTVAMDGPCIKCFGENAHYELGYGDNAARQSYGPASYGFAGDGCLNLAATALGNFADPRLSGRAVTTYWMLKADGAAAAAAAVGARAFGVAALVGGAALLVAAALYSQKRRGASKPAAEQASTDML